MAYLFYTYCDHNSPTLLPYVKATYQGDLSLQQEAFWSGRTDQYKSILDDNCVIFNTTLSLSSDVNSNNKSFENKPNSVKIKKYAHNRNNSTSIKTHTLKKFLS